MSKDTPQSHSFGMGKPNASNQASAQISGKQIQNHVPVNGQPIGAQMQPVYYRDQNGNVAYMQQQTIDEKQLKKMQKKKHGAGFWIAIVIAAIAIIAAIALAVFMFMPHQSSRTGSLGQLDGKTREEIQAEIDRVVEEGMFNISIASAVTFADGTSEGELKIENVPGNRYLMQVDISRNDTGEVIYKSGILEPNHHIQKDRLSVDLDAGEYPCTATFHALDPDTEEEIGQAAAAMNVFVAG